MAKELPIVPTPAGQAAEKAEQKLKFSRVFCLKENSPPLRLLLDFLKSRGQIPLHPKMDPAALDDWAWAQCTLGYHREKKPLQVFCVRDRGSYKELFEKEQAYFLDRLSMHDDEEAGLIRHYVTKARFLVSVAHEEADISEDGYDFNGWILQFYQEQCDGVVQIDGQGFFSPKGDLIVEMEDAD